MDRKSVGLALSSGAARGAAHVGVLSVLEREGIPIDMIAGTSIGAIVGALYASKQDIAQVKEAVTSLSRRRVMTLVDFTIPTKGFIKGKRITGWLKSIIGNPNFTDLKIPFACVATDISTGEEIVINRGSVVEGLRASAAMPVIFTAVKWNGRYLVDGALVDPVPVRVLRDMGADFIIAVNAAPYMGGGIQKDNIADLGKLREPNIFSVLIRIMYIMGYQAAVSGLRDADLVISPPVSDIGPGNFHRARELIRRGEQIAQQTIPEIKRHLEL